MHSNDRHWHWHHQNNLDHMNKNEANSNLYQLDPNKVFFTMIPKTGTAGFRFLVEKLQKSEGINQHWRHLSGNHSRQKTVPEQVSFKPTLSYLCIEIRRQVNLLNKISLARKGSVHSVYDSPSCLL